jgi:hypothetical protein
MCLLLLISCALPTTAGATAGNGTNQQWIGPAAATNQAIVFKPSCDAQGSNCKKCLDLAGGSTANGTPIDIWDCVGNANQKWTYDPKTSAIQYLNDTKKCIDVPGSSTTNGVKLWLWDCNGGKQQGWKGAGIYQFESQLDNGKCMDLSGGDTTNGNKLQIWDCVGSPPTPTPAPVSPTPGSPTPAPPSVCTGNSTDLAAVECAAWQDLYDATNGPKWSPYCSDARSDPCSCNFGGHSTIPYGYGLRCTGGENPIHITYMILHENNLRGTIPSSLAKLSKMTTLFLYSNRLTGLLPPLPFAQYNYDGNGCDLDNPSDARYHCTEPNCNHFKCPLPAGSEQCTWDQGVPGVHCK